LPDGGQIFRGVYQTSNYEVGSDFWPGVTPSGNRLLSKFDGTDPSGVWKLYVYDVRQPDGGEREGTGNLRGWLVPTGQGRLQERNRRQAL
jgi:hypothetical protein